MPDDRFHESEKSVLDSGATVSCAPDCMCPEVKSWLSAKEAELDTCSPQEAGKLGQMRCSDKLANG